MTNSLLKLIFFVFRLLSRLISFRFALFGFASLARRSVHHQKRSRKKESRPRKDDDEEEEQLTFAAALNFWAPFWSSQMCLARGGGVGGWRSVYREINHRKKSAEGRKMFSQRFVINCLLVANIIKMRTVIYFTISSPPPSPPPHSRTWTTLHAQHTRLAAEQKSLLLMIETSWYFLAPPSLYGSFSSPNSLRQRWRKSEISLSRTFRDEGHFLRSPVTVVASERGGTVNLGARTKSLGYQKISSWRESKL